MTIDEAIKIYKEDAEKIGGNPQSDRHAERCRQLAEWLTELKEAKRLLNEAVLAFRIMGEDIDCHFNYLCEKCPLNNNNDWCEWKYQDEALKLIGDVTGE